MNSTDRTAILGGTFTPLHGGHRALLHAAFRTASHDGGGVTDGRSTGAAGEGRGHVVVALTSTALAERTRSDPTHADLLGPFEERRGALEAELERTSDAYPASYEIVRLDDPYGPAATREDVDALVVSPEGKAQRRARELNDRRMSDGRRPLEVHTAPFVVADDGEPISSTRIRNGEIDAHGRVLDDG